MLGMLMVLVVKAPTLTIVLGVGLAKNSRNNNDLWCYVYLSTAVRFP